LDSALTLTPTPTQVWVAEGFYAPTVQQAPGDPNSVSFLIPPTMSIYGGFLGVAAETSPSLRQGQAQNTVLDGNGPNPYHVVTTYGQVTIDGFAIQSGFAVGSGSNSHGAGIYCTIGPNNQGAQLTMVNCWVQNNYAQGRGGGLYAGLGSITMKRCTFDDNFASNGGAIALQATSLVAHNVECFNNAAANYGGAVHLVSTSNVSFANGLIHHNGANAGGAMFLAAGQFTSAHAYLRDCSISQNTAHVSGAGVYAASAGQTSSTTIQNSIVWGNTGAGPLIGAHSVSYSDVEGGYAGVGNINADPLFVSTTTPLDYRLQSGSPCIDVGDLSLLPADVTDLDRDGNTVEALPRDFYGALRVRNSVLDLGCAEY
jgi:hypothetical protein